LVVAFTILAVVAGGVVRGYAGFGASMFWVASLSLIYAPASVVPTVLVLEVVASLHLLPGVFNRVEWRSMSVMLLATLITMPAGVALLAVLPDRTMRIVVAVAILLATLATAIGLDLARYGGRSKALVAGAVSGVVNGSTGIGGPPAVLLYFGPGKEVAVGRATLIAYFLATDAFGFAYMAIYGLVDRTVLLHAAAFVPLAVLGIVLGQRVFRRHGAQGFRTAMLAILLFLGVAMLVRSLIP
jgi:uncharacterized protein